MCIYQDTQIFSFLLLQKCFGTKKCKNINSQLIKINQLPIYCSSTSQNNRKVQAKRAEKIMVTMIFREKLEGWVKIEEIVTVLGQPDIFLVRAPI